MKITFPPDDPSECGGWRNSRVYEALPNVFPVVTYLVILWCVVLHYMAYTSGSPEGFIEVQERFGALKYKVPDIDPFWKLITTSFLHGDFMHLIFNMMIFFTFGTLLERGIGSWNMLIFVIVTSFASSSFGLSIEGRGIGLSGVIYAVIGFMWAAWPRWTGFLERFRGHTVKFFLFWQVICFVLTYTGAYNIGNVAHISGMAFGYLIGIWCCQGNHHGRKWMLASFMFLGLSVLVWFWSPWNAHWRFIDANPELKATLQSLARKGGWY